MCHPLALRLPWTLPGKRPSRGTFIARGSYSGDSFVGATCMFLVGLHAAPTELWFFGFAGYKHDAPAALKTKTASQHACFFETKIAAASVRRRADDDVIKQFDLQQLGRFRQPPR
jgi:hypothetical protein